MTRVVIIALPLHACGRSDDRGRSNVLDVVETMGLEPTTPCLQSRCSSQLSTSLGPSAATPTSGFAVPPPSFRRVGMCRAVSRTMGKTTGKTLRWGNLGEPWTPVVQR
jgi:hypothetical protein